MSEDIAEIQAPPQAVLDGIMKSEFQGWLQKWQRWWAWCRNAKGDGINL
jgi:hypothetical protein